MNVILGCNHLKELGGSEQHLYSLAKAFKELGHNVYAILGNHTMKGKMSDKLNYELSISVDELPDNINYDLVLLSHTTTVNRFLKEFLPNINVNTEKLYQICHGIFHDIEKPTLDSRFNHLCISQEVCDYVYKMVRNYKEIHLCYNPIDTKKFYYTEINETPKSIYSLSQSDVLNKMLSEICNELNIKFSYNNKHTNDTEDVVSNMSNADIVISLGRGCYEALSMGKNVIVADHRDYMGIGYNDGIVNNKNIMELIYNNCSGRARKRVLTKENIISEIRNYNPHNTLAIRKLIEKHFDSNNVANKIIELTDKK